MMIHEFVERTGFTPTMEEYTEIEKRYMEFNGDKDAFCKTFNVEKAHRERRERLEAAKDAESELQKQIKKLQAELDKELAWEPDKKAGTNVAQDDYLHLVDCGRMLSDEEAKKFVSEEFGFAADKIEIIREVSTYEINKYGQGRKGITYRRDPYYEATDWYYVRFNVCGWKWEVHNGNIDPYIS